MWYHADLEMSAQEVLLVLADSSDNLSGPWIDCAIGLRGDVKKLLCTMQATMEISCIVFISRSPFQGIGFKI